MKSNLLRYVLAPALLLAATFSANTLKAETVHVPFNFTVAGKVCPSGLYRVEHNLQLGSGFVTLAGVGTSQRFMWALRPGNPAPTDTRIVLNFSRLGDGHALQSVQYGNAVTPRIRSTDRDMESIALAEKGE